MKRKKYGIGKIHLAADLLNPASQGTKLKSVELLDAMDFISEVGDHMALNTIKIKEDIADYRDILGLWRRQFIWDGVAEKELSPILWWRGLRGVCVLADVAIRILGAPVTSAATERTFSTFSWIHSKKRNRLATQRAAKLTYISHNWKLLHNNRPKRKRVETSAKQSPNSVNEQCDSEDDDMINAMSVSDSDDDTFND